MPINLAKFRAFQQGMRSKLGMHDEMHSGRGLDREDESGQEKARGRKELDQMIQGMKSGRMPMENKMPEEEKD